ncbi:uncharacterized protein BT62DRAFT_52955 [Guyanagaster necrorhizus]|uniref:Uncharacterized protein n=1 Tax=Guyanagaster necrorhizus TaxID=856835 RepID=A0A9P8AZF6_9AGAR|nr:uncharacterized protein BT62DRAFT_52955 [Guyanagaster necrorhizus MCA 3950]KAG7453231.1 hypothetical protein BT62DRAFT_52955 [Guyanagaster necrorhizus MCA 3950]
MENRRKDSRNLNACITISRSLHHFLSILQTSHSQEDDSGDIDEGRRRLSCTFWSREFDDWWTSEVARMNRKRRALSTFDEMNNHLEYLDSICRTTAVQSDKEYGMKFICAQSAVKIITQGIFPAAPESVVSGSLDLLDLHLSRKQDHKFERLIAPQWDDPKPLTQEMKKRIAKVEDLGNSDPISVYPASGVLVPKPRNTLADILEAIQSNKYQTEANNGQKSRPPQVNTGKSSTASEDLRPDPAVRPAELGELDDLGSEAPFSYDGGSGDSELLTGTRETSTKHSEPSSAAPKTSERQRYSSSRAPNTSSPGKRNVEHDEPNAGQSSSARPKEEDLAAMFYDSPWFALKQRNPKQVFLVNHGIDCVPFKVIKGGKALGEWVFTLDMAYRKDALHQLLAVAALHGDDPGNRMMHILQKFDKAPEVVYKETFVSRDEADEALRFTVKEIWCDEDWKFNLEARVIFRMLHRMMKRTRRVDLESDSWLDWLDYSENK